MENIKRLAQFQMPGGEVPGGSTGPVSFEAPSGIPQAFQGGLEQSGTAFFQTVVNNLIILGSFLALVMVIISGIQYIMSRGDQEKLQSARKRFMFAIIGLVIMLGAFFIVRVIIFITGGDWDQFINPASMLESSNQ